MFLKLNDKSYVKYKPNSYIFSSFKEKYRNPVEINESAAKILALCDGTNTKEDIISILSNEYNDSPEVIREYVTAFLEPFLENKLVDVTNEPSKSDIIKGNENIYFPDMLIWEITNYCPLSCKHCYLPNKNTAMASREDINKVLDLIDKSGITQVQVTGGEPMAHPDIEYIVNSLVDRGIIISFTTSGILVNDDAFKYINRIKEVRGSHVKVSLDGSKDTHNKIRMNKLAYDNAIKFIKKSVENGIEVKLGATIMGQSKEEIEELVVTAKNLKVSMIELGNLISQGEAVKNNLSSKIEEIQEFRECLNEKYKDNKFSIKITPDELPAKNCGAGYQIVAIKPNMDVVPCSAVSFKMGNLKEQTFKQIMKNFGEKFSKLESPCKKYCDGCKENKNCSGCLSQGLTLKNKVKDCKWARAQKLFFESVENV